MATRDDEWFEIWYTGADAIPVYLLLVTSNRTQFSGIRVVDPLKNSVVIYTAETYEEICTWLWSDDYHLVNGRQFPDDGW